LTEILRNGARALLAHAVEAEVAGFLGDHADKLTADGRARLVRHGHLPEREIVTGISPVGVRCPRVRDRAADGGCKQQAKVGVNLASRPSAQLTFAQQKSTCKYLELSFDTRGGGTRVV
jgi:hypothetical protein